MSAFAWITITVSAVAIITSACAYTYHRRAVRKVGRQGVAWFDRTEDLPIEQQPDEDAPDAPIPRRPLRGRPE